MVIRQSAATKFPSVVSTSGLISKDRASTDRAAAKSLCIDSHNPWVCAVESPQIEAAERTAASSGPLITSQVILRVDVARSSIPLPPPSAKMMTGARAASSIASERKNSRAIDIFSSTNTASTGNCPTFIASIRAECALACSGVRANATPPIAARPVIHA